MRLTLVLLFALLGVWPAASQGQRPPNIILIIGDDHGYPYYGFTGSDHVLMPNMDLLAREGALFLLGHTTANHCRPALQTLVTGLYPIQYDARANALRAKAIQTDAEYQAASEEERGLWDRRFFSHVMREFETLPNLLEEEGYVSFQGGKWWEQSFTNGGFTDGMSKGWPDSSRGQPGWFREFMGGEGLSLARETLQPVFEFIDRNAERSFFIWYGPSLPHSPLNPPFTYRKYYAPMALSQSAKDYYGNCTWFDAGVGDLLDLLMEKGLRDADADHLCQR